MSVFIFTQKKLSIRVQVEQGSGADPGLSVGGGADLPGEGRQHTNLPDFPKNCMKSRKFWSEETGGECAGGVPLDPPLGIHFRYIWI